MVTKAAIDEFLAGKNIAMAGVSRKKKKFGNQVFRSLKKKGFNLTPINPHAEEIEGVKCYPGLEGIPENVDRLHIMTPKPATVALVEQAINKGIKHIWIQQESDTPEAVKMATDAGINLVHGKCIMMFAQPVKGPHAVHRWFVKLFCKLPD